jgi:hypothetical protein
MRIAVLCVVLGACAAPAQELPPSCPQGATWNGTACAPVLDTSCPAGMRFVSARGCVAVVAPATASPPPSAAPSSPDEDTGGVPRTVWIQRMIAELPPRICAASYFTQCFTTSAADCEAAVATLTRSCLRDRHDTLPRFFDEESGRREGTKIGECVGTAYEAEMRGRGRFVNTAACNDPSRW